MVQNTRLFMIKELIFCLFWSNFAATPAEREQLLSYLLQIFLLADKKHGALSSAFLWTSCPKFTIPEHAKFSDMQVRCMWGTNIAADSFLFIFDAS